MSHKTHSPHMYDKIVPGCSLVTQLWLCHTGELDTIEVGFVISIVCTPSKTTFVQFGPA